MADESSTQFQATQDRKAFARVVGRWFASFVEWGIGALCLVWKTGKIGKFAVLVTASSAMLGGGSLMTSFGYGHGKSHRMDTLITIARDNKAQGDRVEKKVDTLAIIEKQHGDTIALALAAIVKLQGGKSALDAARREGNVEYQQWLRLQDKFGRPRRPAAAAPHDTTPSLVSRSTSSRKTY